MSTATRATLCYPYNVPHARQPAGSTPLVLVEIILIITGFKSGSQGPVTLVGLENVKYAKRCPYPVTHDFFGSLGMTIRI